MSSPKTAAAKTARRPTTPARPAAKRTQTQPAVKLAHVKLAHAMPAPARPTAKPAPKVSNDKATSGKATSGKATNGATASTEAKRLAGEIERALAGGRRDVLSTDALQALMAAVCKTYAARVEAGEQLLPLPERGGATATDVMVTASGLLKAANLAVFELGMWQSWTGR